MITVNLPDGSNAQFPDGTDPTTIKMAVQKKFPPTAAPAPAQPVQPQTYDQSLPAQGLSGVNEGIANALGAPVDLTNLALRGGAAAVHALGGPDIELPVDALGGSQTIKSVMGGAIKPPTQDAGGQMVRRIGQEVGASIVPGAGALGRSATPIREVASTVGTALASGAGAAVAQQVAPDNPYVELAGQIFGGASGATVGKTLQKIVTPFPIDARRAAFTDLMRQNGVELTAGQQTGNKGLQYAESELGGRAASAAMDTQTQQFTRAALSHAGVNADRATPDVMNQAFDDIGNEFTRVAANNTITPDRQLGSDLSQAVQRYSGVVSASNRAPIVADTMNDIIAYARTGQMTGQQYGDMRSRLNEIGRQMAQRDPPLSQAAFGMQGALDNAMERSIAQTNPNDLGALRQARSDYKNLLTIESAVGGAGEAAANGVVTPGNLRRAVAAQSKRGYVRGRSDMGNLARAGVATMTPLPNSGTTPRALVHAVPAAVGSAMGLAAGGAPGAALGTVAGIVAPGLAGHAMLSDLGKRYLTNQVAAGPLGLRDALAGTAAGAFLNDTNQNQRRGLPR